MYIKEYNVNINALKFACDGYTEQFTEDIAEIYLHLLNGITKEHMIDIFEINNNFNALNPTVRHTILCALLTKYLYKEFPTQIEIDNFLNMYLNELCNNNQDIDIIINIYKQIRNEVSKSDVLTEIKRRIKQQ